MNGAEASPKVLHEVLGMELVSSAPGVVLAKMEVTHTVCQPFGFLSGGASLALAETIAAMQDADSVELVGLCTDICVISNVMLIKACLPEVEVVVDAACCAGVTPESHQTALAAMKACQVTVENEA